MREITPSAKILLFRQKLDSALSEVLEISGGKLGLKKREAELITMLFCRKTDIIGFEEEAEALSKGNYVTFKDGALCLTSRGEIAGKSLIQAEERFLDGILKDLSLNEQVLISKLIDEISRNME